MLIIRPPGTDKGAGHSRLLSQHFPRTDKSAEIVVSVVFLSSPGLSCTKIIKKEDI